MSEKDTDNQRKPLFLKYWICNTDIEIVLFIHYYKGNF
jgi:hypothetical protein